MVDASISIFVCLHLCIILVDYQLRVFSLALFWHGISHKFLKFVGAIILLHWFQTLLEVDFHDSSQKPLE